MTDPISSRVSVPAMLAVVLLGAILAGCAGAPAGPSATPVATAVPTPTPVPLPVLFTTWSKSVKPSHRATATIKTAKSAKCSITVSYSAVVSEAKGLSDTSADANGVATWDWIVGSNTKAGTWPIEVICKADGRSGTATAEFTVTN